MDIYQMTIKKFGERAQIEHSIEELSELTVALCHYLAGRKNNVEEEIADVEIMTAQLKYIFSLNKVADERNKKLERLVKLVESEGIYSKRKGGD